MEISAIRVLAIPVLVVSMSGCSTLEVSEVFIARETGKQYVGTTGVDAGVSLMFDEATLFYSAGVFGIPVIPTYVKGGPANTLVLDVTLRLSRKQDYSVAALPCLTTQAGPLCPESVRVTPLFYAGDANLRDFEGRPTYGMIPALSARHVDFTPADLASSGRVTAADVERGCFYRGDPPWVSGQLQVAYLYRCPDTCPVEFDLVTDDIAIAGESFRSQGSFHFEKKRIKDYQAISAAQ